MMISYGFRIYSDTNNDIKNIFRRKTWALGG